MMKKLEQSKSVINKGPQYESLGMILDYSKPGKLIVDMKENVNKMIFMILINYNILKTAKTPAAEHSFKVDEQCSKLNKQMAEDFHTHSAKAFFYASVVDLIFRWQ